MRIIAHRANLTGPDPSRENKLKSIDECIEQRFDVEIDVWFMKMKFWLGHDECGNPLPLGYLISNQDKLWIHAKNIAAAEALAETDLHWFWHERDTLTLTSRGIIWCHYAFVNNGITMLHTSDEVYHLKPNIGGICTDYPVLARRVQDENLRLDNNQKCID